MKKQQFGVIGLGVMGKNLAFNIENKGFSVSAFDSWEERNNEFREESKGKKIEVFDKLNEFVESLEVPRRILIMVKAGEPVDAMISQLKKYISKGDIIIDGGNSFFKDTIRRNKELEKEGFRFIGTGVSGGEEGALNGPAIMPGGQEDAYKLVADIFEAISAKVGNDPCCTYIGENGAGHYVKMIHNGIEYADMQLISEAYVILKDVLKLSVEELYDVFADWNNGELNSYLIEITRNIFSKLDPETGKPMVDVILDSAGQKGTGKWTSQNALDLGISIPTIAESVFARYISSIKEERVAASKSFKKPEQKAFCGDRKAFIEDIRRALYASKICSYAQGFALMREAAKEYGWNLKYGNIAMIFRGGCIIRAQFLNRIKDAYEGNPELKNLMLDPYFLKSIDAYQESWRKVVTTAINYGIPVPGFTSALQYFDSYRTERLSANLLQAQRDYFGAHTFERVDKEGIFHHKWM